MEIIVCITLLRMDYDREKYNITNAREFFPCKKLT